jgi:hypothetical protein
VPPFLLYFFYLGAPPPVVSVTPAAGRDGFGVTGLPGQRDGSGFVSLGVRAGA